MTEIRKIRPGGYGTTPVSVPDLGDDPSEWLAAQAKEHGLTTLLAHADDGVIWGLMNDGQLTTSHDVFGDPPSPLLQTVTLQQARLFGKRAELLLWRGADGWRARLAEDAPDGEHYDESQMLWGNQWEDARDGFTLVNEGRQGLRHAPPVGVAATEFSADHRPLRLQVRHYLHTDPDTGLVRVALSRLVGLKIKAREHKEAQQ